MDLNVLTYFQDWLYQTFKPTAIVYSTDSVKKAFAKSNLSPAEYLRPHGDFKGRDVKFD